ncbi:MAG TPA: CoA transferase [Dyella sp.]|uniref:CoA transferase n=1 Tax=Dyella sp. TaxID=1869338 RepID=UPI002F93AA0E
MSEQARVMTAQAWAALGGDAQRLEQLRFHDAGALPSTFHVTPMASATIATAGLALHAWIASNGHDPGHVEVDSRLASMWFHDSIRPQGWTPPPLWDALAGDYAAQDGWIRLHTNAPAHRAAAQRVLGPHADKTAMAAAVGSWSADALEQAVVEAGGCAATMRSLPEWLEHPQGRAVNSEPLIHREAGAPSPHPLPAFDPLYPLAGVRVLDLTRVLAGPVATRFLAGWGAQVLRIDPPDWDEPGLAPEVTPGKRCARLDLHDSGDRTVFERLLADCDVLVHGYRTDALARLGYGMAERLRLCPGLIDVSLNAYGATGPWSGRRGFDSLVQMSTGIAHAGMMRQGSAKPMPLPVQALDHGTGYLMAAAVLAALAERKHSGQGAAARLSLARTAHWLTGAGEQSLDLESLASESALDRRPDLELTSWGPAQRLRSPLAVGGQRPHFSLPASALGSAQASWRARQG